MIYLVSYDLNKPEQDYPQLIDAIKRYDNACRVLKSQWLIYSDKSATQLFNELVAFVDSNDELFICEVTENRFGRFKQETFNLLQKIQNRVLLKGFLGDFPLR